MAESNLGNELKGIWHQFAGEVKREFSKLTEDDYAAIDGRREIMIGKLQERYGYDYDEAAQALSQFINQRNIHEPGVDPVTPISQRS